MRRRVVITGLGAVSGLGIGAGALWEGLLEGRSALRPITRFDPSGMPCRLAAEVDASFDPKDWVPKSYRKSLKVMARDIQLAVAAAKAAVEDAGLVTPGVAGEDATPTYPSSRLGCQIGAGLIQCELDELTLALAGSVDEGGTFSLKKWGEGGMNNLPPLWLLKYLPNMLACHVTIIHAAQGPSNTITCAEASGLLSIGESVRVIERGDADICFAGGAESKVNPQGVIRMDYAGRVAHTGEETDGSRLVRPYDPKSAGGLLGEVGAIVMVECRETAAARGARAYAEVVGFGAGHSARTGDARERSEGLVAAVEAAFRHSGVDPMDVDAIVPHASGIPSMDAEEEEALAGVFGARLAEVPLMTLTPNIGDGMAGAGGAAVCAAALGLRHQTLPARVHHGRPSGRVSAGAAASRDARLRHVLVCSNALGGQNAAMMLRAVER